MTFGLGDLNGDGRLEIVHGSSTGDLIAVDLQNKTLWSFDNYGYPVERIRCADVNGDGRPEILIASGTGYVYCLDARGACSGNGGWAWPCTIWCWPMGSSSPARRTGKFTRSMVQGRYAGRNPWGLPWLN